ncbi:ATP-binding protein [Plantactinospora sp. CA-290183]|uniref:ATP-binding protein n=1 Tax=Plantactinospora sp. CA-290183 TaxID=3240006 RepID=UPI003D92512B
MSIVLTERAWSVSVPHDARGARDARHRLAAELRDVVPPPLLAEAVAVVGELVGNAVRHAEPLPGRSVRVAWRLCSDASAEAVEVRVTDGGASAAPRVRVVGPDAPDGRGLYIVAALAARWGVERDGLGQTVWAELRAG